MKPALTPFYLFLYFHIASQLLAGDSQLIYTPVEDITIACGVSGTQINELDNRTWSGDVNSEFTPLEEIQVGKEASQVRKTPSSSSISRVPYSHARLSRSKLAYQFPLSTGQKFIRLYFNPASYGDDFDRSEALFSVEVGGYTLLEDFNASATADTTGVNMVYKEFCLNIDDRERILYIIFTPNKAKDAYAFINGIEIVSMPNDLYYSAPRSNGAGYVGQESNYLIDKYTAMETVYRINIGGSSVSSNDDSGLYRNWDSADEIYLDDSSRRLSASRSNPSIQLKFSRSTPEYSAPKEVYQTGRSMDMNKTSDKSYNLTWGFPVDSDSYYLVRLHFCEFEPEITKIGERIFLIYIGNQTAEITADIIAWSGGNGIPVYRDYVIWSNPGSLFIALQPFQMWQINYKNAMLNGIEIINLVDQSKRLLAGPNLTGIILPKVTAQSIKNSKSPTPMLVIIAAVVSTILVFFVIGFFVFSQRWKVKDSGSCFRKSESTMSPGSSLPSYPCRYFSLVVIKAATKNFNDNYIIGAGGFGNVYKGFIDGEVTPVAIKRLKPESSQGAHEFKTEIELLSQLRHRHLVSLIGYCTEKGEMILVYDYMEHGTLRDHLYHTVNSPLSWERRLQICIGTAQGLQYLHGGAKGTIIHRDVKSTNILLDEKWVAKVSDFGLSKMGTPNMSKTHISTVVKGSFGYLDPEYYRRQRLTEKSDVYSFGVVLFEVLSARPAVINTAEMKQMNLAEWAKTCHHNGELDQIIDSSLTGKIATESLNKFVEIALSCVHDNSVARPSMDDILRGLELAMQIHQSSEKDTNSLERKGETQTSTSREQSCAATNSIACISGTIFSEINNPSGR